MIIYNYVPKHKKITQLFTIRPAYRHDIPQLVGIFERYRVFYGMEPDTNRAETFLLSLFKGDDSVIFIAEDEQKNIIGFTQLYPLFSSTRMKRLWLLNDLFVSTEVRGKGIGKQLIERAKQHARDSQSCGLILETAKSNVTANKLYLAEAFVPDIHHNYYYWNI